MNKVNSLATPIPSVASAKDTKLRIDVSGLTAPASLDYNWSASGGPINLGSGGPPTIVEEGDQFVLVPVVRPTSESWSDKVVEFQCYVIGGIGGQTLPSVFIHFHS
jgi:hypothetical protein